MTIADMTIRGHDPADPHPRTEEGGATMMDGAPAFGGVGTSAGLLSDDIDRRRFMSAVAALLAAGAAPLTSGCTSTHDNSTDRRRDSTAENAGLSTKEPLEALYELARSSPDHLPAAAQRLMTGTSSEAIVEFVGGSISVLPPRRPTDSWADAMRWGPEAALRCGSGTLRERAQLMVTMLTAAGFTAVIKKADLPNGVEWDDLMVRRDHRFSVDGARLAAIQQAMGDAARSVDLDGDLAAEQTGDLADELLKLLPTGQNAAQAVSEGPTQVPVVEFEVHGDKRWAFAIADVGVVSEEPRGLSRYPEATLAPPTVSLSVEVLPDRLPGAAAQPKLEVASATWRGDELAGGNVTLTFPPLGDPKALLLADHETLTMRQPLLSLHGGDSVLPKPNDTKASSNAAKPVVISTAGAVFSGDPDNPNRVIGPYGVLDGDTSATDRTAALDSVASIQVTANPGSFPEVEVAASVLDSSGAPVPGLVASDFSLVDGSESAVMTLLSNTSIDEVRVLVVYDTSGSVLETFPTPEDRATFEATISDALGTAASRTPFVTRVVAPGQSAIGQWPTADTPTIAAALAQQGGSGSDIWGTLGSTAPAAGASAAIFISDFQSTDDPRRVEEWKRAFVESGMPVALIAMGKADEEVIGSILASSNDTARFDSQSATIGTELAGFLQARATRIRESAYRLRYHVVGAAEPGAIRSVTLSLAERSDTQGATDYQVPAAGTAGPPSGVQGIYLTIRSDGTSATRRLAGLPLRSSGNPIDRPATADELEDVRGVLNGLVTINFEAGRPTDGLVQAELIDSLISVLPLKDASGDDLDRAFELGTSLRRRSLVSAIVARSHPTEARLIDAAPAGLGVTITMERPSPDGVVTRVDVVPEFVSHIGCSTDPSAGFRAAMVATLPWSLHEADVCDDSAAKRLASSSLQLIAANATVNNLDGYDEPALASVTPVLDLYSAWHRLVPTDPTTAAFWVVDPNTGTTIAIDSDGTGGGLILAKCNPTLADHLNFLLALVSVLCSYGVIGAGPVGAFACLGATIASVVQAAATIIAMSKDPTLGDLGDTFGGFGSFANTWGAKQFGVLGLGLAYLPYAKCGTLFD